MKKKSLLLTKIRFLNLIAASLLGMAATAHGQTVIDHLPYTITSAGLYVLNNNLSSPQTNGSLITINASNVTIDMQGHYISGPVGDTTQFTTGISSSERSNLTVQNGTIAYCRLGIYLKGNNLDTTNNVNLQVQNMRVTSCYQRGIEFDYAPASRIANCQVSQIGFNGATNGTGISVFGSGTTVQSCIVSNIVVTPGNTCYCIRLDTGSCARQNQVSHGYYGIAGGIYQDTIISGCTTPFTGGVDGGGNVHD